MQPGQTLNDRMPGRKSPPTSIHDVNLDVLENTLSFYIRSINYAVSRDLDDCLKGCEVARGSGKITTLLLTDSHRGIRPSVLAQLLMTDKSGMTRIIDQMVGHGLIERRTSPTDSRAHELYVTEKGARLASHVRVVATAQSEAFFSDMPESDKGELLRILRAAYRRIVGLPND